MKKILKVLNLIAILALVSSCGKNVLDPSSSEAGLPVVSQEEALTESAITLISGSADDQSTTSYALHKSIHNPYEFVASLLLPTATADGCSRALAQSCLAGVRAATFSGCSEGASGVSLSGNLSLTYSDAGCDMSLTNDSVTRTYGLNYAGPRGGSLAVSSDSRADYRGVSMGGGGRLTKTAGGWNLDVLGKHKILSYNGHTLYNVSMRTTAPIQISGSLARSGRVVTGGQLEVNHNLAGATAVFQPNNLQWNGVCCHPVSGSMNITYSGSASGTATVSFTSCGLAEFTKGGQTKEITISYCE